MIDLLAENPLLLLFTVIGVGYLVGNIRIFGFSLGVAAVLFAGIACGAIDKRLQLPEYIYVIGLVLFVYAIGLQSGAGFFASFRKRGLRTNLIAATLIASGGLLTILLWRLLGISAPSAAGLFCGALTNTPALAATIETIHNLAPSIPAASYDLYVRSPVVTYGLAYPFGVFGAILWFYVFTRLFKADIAHEKLQGDPGTASHRIMSRTFRVTNPAVFGKRVEEAVKLLGDPGFTFSRIKTADSVSIVTPETILHRGDTIVAVGNADALGRAGILLGEEASEQLSLDTDVFGYKHLFVSNKAVIGKSIRDLQLHKELDATITRLRRGDVDFVPSPDTILELGDRIRVVAKSDNFDRITVFFGDSLKSISETDFLSLSLGIVIGVFVGMIPLPLPNGSTFKLGFAGGPLIVALILGRLERTGPISWGLPFNANLVLRQVGLVFFLAAIGTKAGGGLGATLANGGFGLIAAGAFITSFVVTGAIFIGYRILGLPMSAVMGMVSGMQTQPACLAYANQQAQNELPNVWYATVYPVSMITKIILAQIIVSTLLLASI